jgi:hypothetical protein
MNVGMKKSAGAKASDLSWGIDSIVADLRRLRDQSLEVRNRKDHPRKLPSRKSLVGIMEGFSAALFPNRLGIPIWLRAASTFLSGKRWT